MVNRSLLAHSFYVHETSLIWKDTNIFNNANLCTKNNDHAASVVVLVHSHAHILADHVAVIKRLLKCGASATAGCVSRLVTVVLNASSAARD